MTRLAAITLAFPTLLLPVSQAAADSLACTSSGFTIPDGNPSGTVTPLIIPPGDDPMVVVDARLELEITHPWVGDLVVELIAPSGGVSVVLLERPGMVPAGFPGPFGCGGDDMTVTLDDAAADAISQACTTTDTPVYQGALRPQRPLAAFIGTDPVGAWSLRIADLQPGDPGSLVSACLRLEVATDCDGDGLPDDCTSCVGDLDDDAVVGGSDLSILLGFWGSGNQVADIDGDGEVGGSDLSMLLGQWGACP